MKEQRGANTRALKTPCGLQRGNESLLNGGPERAVPLSTSRTRLFLRTNLPCLFTDPTPFPELFIDFYCSKIDSKMWARIWGLVNTLLHNSLEALRYEAWLPTLGLK